MSTSDTKGFLQKYLIESPEPSALAVYHAEPVVLVPMERFTFSPVACDLIRDLMGDGGRSVDQFLKNWASDQNAHHHSIIIFLDGPYHLAEHIWTVRSSIEEIAMFSLTTPRPDEFSEESVSGLCIADVETLADLAQRSPFLGLLLTIADGPPDDAIWAYFLGRAETKKEEAEETVEFPMKRLEPTGI